MNPEASLKSKSQNKPRKAQSFANRLATILLVQTKLLPPSALGVKDLKNKI